MVPNYNFPWYIQDNPDFVGLYNALYDIACMASPLGIGDAFDLDKLSGNALSNLGALWGISGSFAYNEGLTYGVDDWSGGKTWGGNTGTISEDLYRNFLRMHIYINGRNFDLGLINDALAILLAGYKYTVTVDEGFMNFTINIIADSNTLAVIEQISAFDSRFLGKPSGISYKFNFIQTD